MTLDLQKSLNSLLVLLTICLGLLVGQFAADWLGMVMAPKLSLTGVAQLEPIQVKKQRLQDFSAISQRNLFDSNAKPAVVEETASTGTESKGRTVTTPPSDLQLLGTVAGGGSPLAVIKSGKETNVYRIGEALPGDLSLARVERDRAIAVSANGEETILELVVEKTPAKTSSRSRATPRTNTTPAKIIELGENRWQIPREEAEKARSNLNTLLKTARMVPKIEGGATVGFTIVNIQPGTFLDMLGLKVGDVLVQINQVELNSPEKALQIFQQVREANNLSLGLLRNGSRQTFEYTID